MSEEEMTLLTGENKLTDGAAALAAQGAKLVLVTLGSGGAYYHTDNRRGLCVHTMQTVDTTGAGGAFLGALLSCMADKTLVELRAMSSYKWEKVVTFANAAGSLTTTAKGAIPAMPTRGEIEACMKNVRLKTK